VKVSIVGSSGRIGQSLMHQLAVHQGLESLELQFFTRKPECLEAQLCEWQTLGMAGRFLISRWPDESSKLEGTSLVVILSGAKPTDQQRAIAAKIDTSGRLAQAIPNFSIVQEIGTQIFRYSRSSRAIVVTNQSDLMAMALRQVLSKDCVFGFGGMLDTLRYRAASDDSSAHVIGLHNDDMFLSERFISAAIGDPLEVAKGAGKLISNKYRPMQKGSAQIGAYLTPAFCLMQTIEAFAGLKIIRFPFNQYLPVVGHGSNEVHHLEVSLPVTISRNRIFFDEESSFLTHNDVKKLEKLHKKIKGNYDQVEHYSKRI